MNPIKDILLNRENVDVDKNNNKNVYDDSVYNDNVAYKIQDALDKPKAIGEILAEKLNAPENIKFYIKLAYMYPQETLFECISITKEMGREGKIKTTEAQYFWGILKRKAKRA